MNTFDPAENDVQSRILVMLGELKGQMSAIQGFLASHSDRMDRQDKRADDLEAAFAKHKLDTAISESNTAQKQDSKIAKVSEGLKKTELRMAMMAGGLAVVVFLLEFGAKIGLLGGN